MEETSELVDIVERFAVKVRKTEIFASDSRQRYREKIARITLDSMVQFVGLLDAQGRVLEINKVALDAVGITLAEVEGKPFWTTFWWQVSDDNRNTLIESIRRAARGEFVRWDAEIFGRAGGKETIIIDVSLQPVMDEHGTVVFLTAEGRDITEKNAQEREIAQKNVELQILLDKVRQIDKLKTQFSAGLSHEFRTSLTLMLGQLEESLGEFTKPLVGYQRGRQELVKGFEERAKQHSLLMQAPIAVCVLEGPDHVYTLANEEHIKLSRLEGRQLLGLSLFEARPEIKGQGFEELLDNVYRTGIPHYGKELHLAVGAGENQTQIVVDFVFQPKRNLIGEIDGILAITTDVTEKVLARRNIEETAAKLKVATDENARLLSETRQYALALREADSKKDEFIATLAHELRNPLAPIRNGLHILRVSDDADEQQRIVGIMENQLLHMVHLIDDLLDISRITQGKIELRLEPVSLQSAIQSAIDASAPDLEAAGHVLTIDVPDRTINLSADMTRLTQIITNLLNNAAKYTPHGGRVHLSASVEDDSALVTISDNGVGISAEHAGRIFELFTQLDDTGRESQNGLGIGLALVKYLVEMHGGTVQVESEGRGKGSTFTIRLPVAEECAEVAAQVAPAVDTGDRQQKILIVDDNVASAQTIGWMLELSGYAPMLAHDGPQTLALARQHHPDTILLDIGLPGMNGYDVCRELRKDSAFKDTIIIAQTGWGQKRDREMAIAAGFDHHLVKPIGLDQITELLSNTAKLKGRQR